VRRKPTLRRADAITARSRPTSGRRRSHSSPEAIAGRKTKPRLTRGKPRTSITLPTRPRASRAMLQKETDSADLLFEADRPTNSPTRPRASQVMLRKETNSADQLCKWTSRPTLPPTHFPATRRGKELSPSLGTASVPKQLFSL
jgi:hypothetical protein